MVVGIGSITFRIHDCRSLKGKRKVVKAIVARIRNHFNASVAEVADNDVYQSISNPSEKPWYIASPVTSKFGNASSNPKFSGAVAMPVT